MGNDLLTALFKAGAVIEVTIPWKPEGVSRDWITTVEDAELYVVNAYAFAAERHGVTEEEFRLWVSDGGSVFCNATTSRKTPCKNVAVDGYSLEIQDYLRFRARGGGYCWAHGG